jgi:membrane-associated phospholipid phosphatase
MGTPTPAGHWTGIAADLITRFKLTDEESARTLALLNIAMMDASIACWNTKYLWWVLRPSHADPAIRISVALPNFPSYPSGHAAFSGAASEILANRFPTEADHLRAMAEEAAQSRIRAGIHYPFDSTAGLSQGRAVARLTLTFAEQPGLLLDRIP